MVPGPGQKREGEKSKDPIIDLATPALCKRSIPLAAEDQHEHACGPASAYRESVRARLGGISRLCPANKTPPPWWLSQKNALERGEAKGAVPQPHVISLSPRNRGLSHRQRNATEGFVQASRVWGRVGEPGKHRVAVGRPLSIRRPPARERGGNVGHLSSQLLLSLWGWQMGRLGRYTAGVLPVPSGTAPSRFVRSCLSALTSEPRAVH